LPIPAGWQADIYLETDQFREVSWAEKRPKDTVIGWTQGLALRVLRSGRQGFAFATDISRRSLKTLWDRASAMAERTPADPRRRLRRPSGARRTADPFSQVDPALFQRSVADLRSLLAAQEKALLASDRRLKKALRLSLRESRSDCALLSTEGAVASHTAASVSFSVELMGESRRDVQVSWDSAEKRRWKDLDLDRVAGSARDRLLSAFGARPLSSGTWPVIFEPRVGVDLLELLSDAFRADEVKHGKSFLAGKKGKAVASPLVTLVDDGRLPEGLASSLRDGEGCPRQTTVVMREGVLQDYLYDSYTAAKEGRESTGNAGRGLHGPPSPDSTNFYMAAGRLSAEKLRAETPRAFQVQDVLGMHTADAVSGDFSVGASGLLIEGGRAARSVKGVTLAGNVLDLLAKVDAVADDLAWHGATGAPTFRVSGLSIGGN
jgi:PmbA protein